MLQRVFRSERIMNQFSDFERNRQSFFMNLFKFLYELKNDRKSFSLLFKLFGVESHSKEKIEPSILQEKSNSIFNF